MSADEVPADVVHARPGDLLSTGSQIYEVLSVGRNPRWLVVLNLLSGKESRRKADDFELWARA